MKTVNEANLYEMQDDFDELMSLFKEKMDVDNGVIADLCLTYVRNMVINDEKYEAK